MYLTGFTVLALSVCLTAFGEEPSKPAGSSTSSPAGSVPSGPTPSTASKPAEAIAPKPAESAPKAPTIATVNGAKDNVSVRLGDTLSVKVEGLGAWIARNVEASKKLRLFLDGREVVGLEPVVASSSREEVIFPLDMRYEVPEDKAKQQRAAWVNAITLGARQHRVPISVGPEGSGDPFTSTVNLRLHAYSTGFGWIIISIVLLTLGAVFYLGKKSDMLRDTPSGPIPANKRACFSLAKFQMACWFVLVVGGYLYITLVTFVTPQITATVLALIGISAATGLSAAIVDTTKSNEKKDQRRALESERTSLSTRVTQLQQQLGLVSLAAQPAGALGVQPAPAAAPLNAAELSAELQEKQSKLAKVEADLGTLPALPPVAVSSGNFFLDILRDDGSVSFHRFQIFVWTIVLGVLFFRSVVRDLVMPDFDATLLGLMGISSGTYLGFKFPEKPAPQP